MSIQDSGKIVIISAPSGCGKDTLIREVLRRIPDAVLSTSFTSRDKRCNDGVWEQEGVEYFFRAPEAFPPLVAQGFFAEHSIASSGDWYATPAERLKALLAEHAVVILNIEGEGMRQICRAYPDAVSIFLLPPGREELERRLRSRNSGSEADTLRRMNDARALMPFAPEYGYAVVNDDLQRAAGKVADIIRSECGDAACASAAGACLTANNLPLIDRLLAEFRA